MPAAYDTYDYPSYWENREYEHECELIAIKEFLAKIPKVGTVLEVGAGFGRLAQAYIFRAKKVILSDPSSGLLKIARSKLTQRNVRIIHAGLDKLPEKIRPGTIDLIVMVRVLHHLENVDLAVKVISRLLKTKGYLILEFANKRHAKATFLQMLRGNLTFPLEIFPKDIRSKKSVKNQTLPFINYHPDFVYEILRENGFTIIEKRSVSNIRSPFIKRIVPLSTLLYISEFFQKPLGFIGFGPSIFVLAQKKG